MYDPACLWCGARLIRKLGAMSRPRAEITARRTNVLADWMALGHEEAELRRLAKLPACFAPNGPGKPTESERRKSAKRR